MPILEHPHPSEASPVIVVIPFPSSCTHSSTFCGLPDVHFTCMEPCIGLCDRLLSRHSVLEVHSCCGCLCLTQHMPDIEASFSFPSISWWMSWFLLFGPYEQCCCERLCISFYVGVFSVLFGLHAQA